MARVESSLRVLHILHESPLDPRGGLGVHVAGLAAAQVANGHEVTVLGMAQSSHGGLFVVEDGDTRPTTDAFWDGAYRVAHAFNLNRHLKPTDGYNDLANFENYMASLLHADRDLQVDVIHLHDAYLAPVATAISAWLRCPIVLTVHLSCAVYAMGLVEDRHYRWCCERELQACHCAAALITVSDAYAKSLKETFLVDDVTVIPNGVDAQSMRQIGAKFRPREKTAAFMGRLVEQKGVGPILEAAKLLPEWEFVLVASVTDDLEGMHPLVQPILDAPSNVRWIRDAGYGPSRWEHVRGASVALVPSVHEPFGIVALEWMALGVPLITSRVDGLGDFCTDQNSWHCEPSSDGIVAALLSFERDEDRVKAARQTATDHNWNSVALETVEVYRDATRSRTLAA